MQKFVSLSLAFICFFIACVSANVNAQKNIDTTQDKVFSTVEEEASFPGGDAAWAKYITKAFEQTDIEFKNSDQGTCNVKFIVDINGNISNAEAMNMKRTRLAKFAVELILNGPKWNPAMQNGRAVNAFRVQPITFRFSK